MTRLYAFTLLLHAYVGWRLLPDLSGYGMPGLSGYGVPGLSGYGVPVVAAMAAWLLASALLLPMGLFARRLAGRRLAGRLAWAGLVAMGSFSSLFVLTFLRDVALLAAFALDAYRFQAWSAAAVPLLAALLTLVGFFNARRNAKVRAVDVLIAGLPVALHGFRIAQITDIHIGPTIKRPYVQAIVDAVNALGVDLIAVTGDLVDGSVQHLAGHAEPLAGLSARHGAFFVTGNHEYYSGAAHWIVELRRLGLRVLLNEHVVIEHAGESIVVAGVTDYNAHHYDSAHQSDPAAAARGAPAGAALRLLLAHQPRSAFAAQGEGYHLQLSGHTHGGQFWPWNHFVRLQQPYTAGLRRLGGLWVYTSRGTGYWGPPKRIGAPSEITCLRLLRA